MRHWQRVAGQVLLAVGGVLALGGLASFVFPKVELRILGSVASTPEARWAWVVINTIVALVGLWVLRRNAARRASVVALSPGWSRKHPVVLSSRMASYCLRFSVVKSAGL